MAALIGPCGGLGDTHFFETMMQVQKSIGALVAKTDRLITDVEQQDKKLDRLRLWAAGVISEASASRKHGCDTSLSPEDHTEMVRQATASARQH